LIGTPQAIEHHRFDRFTHRKVPQFRVLLGRLVNDAANVKFVEHASHKAEVIQDLATVRGLVGHNNLL
jgi:hypothetical protein